MEKFVPDPSQVGPRGNGLPGQVSRRTAAGATPKRRVAQPRARVGRCNRWMDHAISTALADPRRLAALRATGLLDTPPEPSFDRIVALARRVLGASAAVVSLLE